MLAQSHVEHGKTFLCYLTGLLKGLLLLPLILPWMILSVLTINVLSFPTWLNHGYFALRFTRLLGPNLKVVLGLLYPVALLLWVALTTAATVPIALFTALSYSGWFTLHAKRQTAWRWAYVWAGWRETLEVVAEQHSAYALACNVGFVHYCGTLRRQPWPTRYDIHPLAVLSALLMGALGGALLACALAPLAALKALPCAWRALANQWQDREIWWRSAGLSAAWALSLLLAPPAVLALAVPSALLWALYAAVLCAGKTLEAGGLPLPGLHSLLHSAQAYNSATTRYILQQDVPHVDYSADARPLSPLHALLGLLITAPLALVLTPLALLLPLLLNILPTALAAASWALYRLQSSLEGKRPAMAPLALLGLLLIPAAVPLGLAAVLVSACLVGAVQGCIITHSSRSLTSGIRFVLGNCYMHEYAVHKFALVPRGSGGGAAGASATVHWASFFPPQWGLYAQPYMSTGEWDGGAGGARIPISVVGKPARYLPPGMRRPRLAIQLDKPPPLPPKLPWWLAALTAGSGGGGDEEGAMGVAPGERVDMAACTAASVAHSAYNNPTVPWLDMCSPAYDVPGVGVTRMGMDGVLAAPVPRKAPGALALPPPPYALRYVSHDPAALHHVYGEHRLPAAYRAYAARQRAAGVDAGVGAGAASYLEDALPPAARYTSGLAGAAAAAGRAADVLEAEMFARQYEGDARGAAALQQASGTGLASGAHEAVYGIPSALNAGTSASGAGVAPPSAPSLLLSASAKTLLVGATGAGTRRGLQPIDDHSDHSSALCCLCCMASEEHVYEGGAEGGGAGAAGAAEAGAGAGAGSAASMRGPRGEILLPPSTLHKQREAASERRVRRGAGDSAGGAAKAPPGAAGSSSGSVEGAWGVPPPILAPPPALVFVPGGEGSAGAGAGAGAAAAASSSSSSSSSSDPTLVAAAGSSSEDRAGGSAVAAALALAANALTASSLATSAAASARAQRAAAAAGGGGGAARDSASVSVDSVAIAVAPLPSSPGSGRRGEEEEEEEEDEIFVLGPVVREDLPDEWVAVPTGDGESYYVNYARNQSTWRLPS